METAEIKNQADLLKELNSMKEGLEAKAKKDANEIIEAQIKEVNKKIDGIKGLPEDVTPDTLKQMQKDLQTTIDDFDKWQVKMNAFVKGGRMQDPEKVKSFNERLAEAVEEKHDDVQKFIKGETKKLSLDIKAVGAVSLGNVSGTTNYGSLNEGKFVQNPNNIGHVRSLIPVRPVAGPATDYYFMYENGAGEGSIAPTAETTAAAAPTTQATGLKPQFDVDLTEASVKFEFIAGWMLMSRKAMKNIPGFLGFLQSRLPERLLDAEDAALLYGNGTSPNVKGILASGNFVAGQAAGATALVEKIIKDITLLEDTYKRLATGIVLRPVDFNNMFINKASGSGEYDLPPGVTLVNGQLSILGVPVAKSTSLTTGDYVVGDFKNGAELLIGEAMNLQFFEQDSTNVRTNQITVRIEEEIAFPVYGSNFFVKGSSALS